MVCPFLKQEIMVLGLDSYPINIKNSLNMFDPMTPQDFYNSATIDFIVTCWLNPDGVCSSSCQKTFSSLDPNCNQKNPEKIKLTKLQSQHHLITLSLNIFFYGDYFNLWSSRYSEIDSCAPAFWIKIVTPLEKISLISNFPKIYWMFVSIVLYKAGIENHIQKYIPMKIIV